MLFQLPSILPSNGMQNGKAGRLLIRRSGRITLVIGNVEFHVTSCPVSRMNQTLAYADPEESSLCFLGKINDRFVCTPNIEALL